MVGSNAQVFIPYTDPKVGFTALLANSEIYHKMPNILKIDDLILLIIMANESYAEMHICNSYISIPKLLGN